MYTQPLPTIGFCNAIKICFQKYCIFTGRARRSEFWSFFLFSCLFSIIPGIYLIISFIMKITKSVINITQNIDSYSKKEIERNIERNIEKELGKYSSFSSLFIFFAMIIIMINLILTIPMISAGVRRLHDTGKSGLYLLLSLIPFGNLILIFFLIEDSHQAPNIYGPSPKYPSPQNGTLVNNQSIQLTDMSNIYYSQPPFVQAYPQQIIYPNMYQQYPPNVQNPIYPQYPQANQQIPYQENFAQKPAPLVQEIPSNNQAGIIMPVVYP